VIWNTSLTREKPITFNVQVFSEKSLAMRAILSAIHTIIAVLVNMLFGCCHRHTTFPQSVRWGQHRPRAAYLTGMYVVCLKCGREFAYDWDEMRIVTNEKEFVHAHAAVEAELRG